MKILLQTRFHPAIGGIESLARILVETWCEQGHGVTVSTDVAVDEQNPYVGPGTVHYQPSGRALLMMWREHDVVVHMMIGLKFVWPAIIINIPSVFVHHSTYWVDREERRDWRERLKLKIARMNSWNICVSRFIRNATSLPAAQVVWNCFDGSVFHTLEVQVREHDLIFVGRLVSDKGVDLLLDAIRRCDGGEQWSITLVGGGPEEFALRRQAAELGLTKVRFTGPLAPSEVANELRRHRVMVVPSLWREPFGIVALEGMACGAVPIVADGGGLPEAVGDAGIVFKRGDIKDLADKLQSLLSADDHLEKLREKSRTHLLAYTDQGMCDAYLAVMKAAVEGRKAIR